MVYSLVSYPDPPRYENRYKSDYGHMTVSAFYLRLMLLLHYLALKLSTQMISAVPCFQYFISIQLSCFA